MNIPDRLYVMLLGYFVISGSMHVSDFSGIVEVSADSLAISLSKFNGGYSSV
jgi:hypothetical protein